MQYAVTGHRPNKLLHGNWTKQAPIGQASRTNYDSINAYSEQVHQWLKEHAINVFKKLLQEPADLIPSVVYSGMALGWDQAVVEACLELHIDYVSCVPYHGFERQWGAGAIARYHRYLKAAQKVHVVCEGDYSAWKLKRRNVFMVDRSKVLVALWDGSHGGTQHTVMQGQTQSRLIVNVWESWKELRDRRLKEGNYFRSDPVPSLV